MKRRDIRRVIQAGRPPAIQRVIEATSDIETSLVVTLGVGRSIADALDRLPSEGMSGSTNQLLLIPDLRRLGQPGPRLTFAVASRLSARSSVTIALPTVPSDAEGRRWKRLADRSGAELAILGRAGWNRAALGDRSLILTHADLPAELHFESMNVALSVPNGAGCLGLWNTIVHPNTALRARTSPNAGIELSAAVDASYLLAGRIGSAWVAAWVSTAIAAELLARGFECLRERSRGIESPGPWEDSGVQHLSGIGKNGLIAANMVLRARLEDTGGEELARRLSEILGWRLEIESDDDTGGVSD